MEKMIKKYIFSAALIALLAPVGVWAMDNTNMDNTNDEEQKERREDLSGLFADVENERESYLRQRKAEREIRDEIEGVLALDGMSCAERRALLSPATQRWLDREIFNPRSGYDLLDFLILGAPINTRDEQGKSLLELAVEARDSSAVEFLLKYDVHVDEQMRVGIEQLRLNERLLAAIRENRKDKVEALLNTRADVNYRCLSGSSPLDCASFFGFYGIIELLLDRGADVNKVSDSVYSKGLYLIPEALSIALLNVYIDVVRTLIMAGARIETKYDLETAHLEIKTKQDSYKGKSMTSYSRYSLVDSLAQAIIHAIAMRDMLGEQDWSSEDVQKNSSLMAYLPVPGLRGLVGDYADFYDETCACDYGPLNESNDRDKMLALVSEYALMREDDGEEIVPNYVSFYRIIKREIERRRRRREAGQPSVLRVERPIVNVQAVAEEEETKEAAAQSQVRLQDQSQGVVEGALEAHLVAELQPLSGVSSVRGYFSAAQGSEEDVQEVACFNCTLLNSAGQTICRACGVQLPDINGFFDQE